MTVLYRATSIKSHFDPARKTRYIARACKREIINTDDLSRLISDRSTLSRADITAALYAFEEIIPELLLNNYSIHLKPLGIFSLSIKSKAEDAPAQVNNKSIKEIKLNFKPDTLIKKRLKSANIKKVV